MKGQNLNLRPLAKRLESIVVKQEDVAKEIKASNVEDFARIFALEIVKKKLVLSKLDFEEREENDFPFLINQDGGYFVGVVPRKLLKDERKNKVESYCNKVSSKFGDFKIYPGVILFLPYLMNSNILREQLYDRLHIGFVNLAYDNRSLERRFNEYCLK